MKSMKSFFKKINKNLLMVWALSYVTIISILLIVITTIVGLYNGAVQKQAYEFNNYVFESVTSSVNSVLLNINNLHLTLIRNDNLTAFMTNDERLYSKDVTYELLDDIKAYNQYIVDTDLFFIYLKDIDCVLSLHGITESYLFFKTYFNPEKISYEQWKSTLLGKKNDQYITMYYKNSDGVDIETIAFLFQVPIDHDKGVGVILSGKQHFIKDIEKIDWKSLCDIYIYNSYGNLVIYDKNSEGGEPPRTISQLNLLDNEKNTVYTSNVTVDKNNWRIATVVQNDTLNRQLIFTQIVIVGIIICSLVLLFFIVRYLLKVNYRPIKSMLSLFGVTESKDEYGTLYESINKTIDSNTRLLKDMEVKEKKLRTIAMARIIKGNLSYLSLDEYSLEFKGKYYAVLSFYLDDISALFRDDVSMPDFERHYHLRYIIDNVMEEIFGAQGIKIYTTEIDEFIVCLLNLESNADEKKIRDLIEKGVKFISKHFEISPAFALSEVHEGFLNLPSAYSQTVEILEHKRILGIDEPVEYSELAASPKSGYVFNFLKEQSLAGNIKTRNTKDAVMIVEQIFKELENNKSFSLDYITYVVLDIASTVTKSANEILAESFSFETETTLYKNIKNSESLSNLHAQIVEYIETVCDAINSDLQEKRSRAQYRVNDIKQYVTNNFTDPDLNITSIGFHFDMTPAYISKIFKDETGIPLADYINKLRIERARELIARGRHSIKEASAMAGFNHERTFYRAQKKLKEML